MELSSALLTWAAARPPVLVAAAPGGTADRLAVERELRTRGWPAARSPAEAALLAVCGIPGPGFAGAVDRIWAQMPAPRARVDVATASDPATALHLGRRLLSDPVAQRREAVSSGRPTGRTDMEMELPGGWPMADRGPDRDGLALDRLHVPLGPVLPDWPHGLTVRCVLQGDVIQDAEVEVTDGGAAGTPFWDEPWLRALQGERVARGDAARRRAACHLDSVGRLLGVAGWPGAALRAARLRDALLAGEPATAARRQHGRFARRVTRSRLLRWLTDGIHAGAGADVTARWMRWMTDTGAALERLEDVAPLDGDEPEPGPRGRLDAARMPSVEALDELPALLRGVELAAARLIVAAVDPDPDELVVRTPADG